MIEECLVAEFLVGGDDCPLSRAAAATGVAIDARPPQLRGDGNVLLRFSAPVAGQASLKGHSPGEEHATADTPALDGDDLDGTHLGGRGGVAAHLDADDSVRYLHRAVAGDRAQFRCLSKEPCVVHELVDEGFLVESMRYEADGATMTGAVVGHEVLRGVMAQAAETVGVRLRRLHRLGAEDEGDAGHGYGLTPAQLAALRTAHEMGYFGVPKGCTATDVADELGISKSAFLERLRRGQARLYESIL